MTFKTITNSNYFNTPLKRVVVVSTAVGLGLFVAYRLRIVWIAKKYEGVAELAGNSGFADKAFEDMMKSVGFQSGEAWCSTFAKAIWMKAYGQNNKNLDKILSKSTQTTWANAKNDKTGTVKVIEKGGKPRPGDIAIWQKNKGVKGHAGIVVKSDKNTFTTIEGNTNEAGSREGDRVLKKVRTYDYDNIPFQLKGFIRKKIF